MSLYVMCVPAYIFALRKWVWFLGRVCLLRARQEGNILVSGRGGVCMYYGNVVDIHSQWDKRAYPSVKEGVMVMLVMVLYRYVCTVNILTVWQTGQFLAVNISCLVFIIIHSKTEQFQANSVVKLPKFCAKITQILQLKLHHSAVKTTFSTW